MPQVAQREKRVTGLRQQQRRKLEQLSRGRKRERSDDDDNDGDDNEADGVGADAELESEGDATRSAGVPPDSAGDSARESSPVGRPLQRTRESMGTSSSSPRPSPVRKPPAAINCLQPMIYQRVML